MQRRASARTNWLFVLLFLVALIFVGVTRLDGVPMGTLLREIGFEWVIILAGVALLLGVVNVIWLHIRRILMGERDWILSLALLAVLTAVVGTGLLSPAGMVSPLLEWIFDALIAPGQAALYAMLVFFMAAAAFQYLRVGRRGGTWMLLGFLLVLLVQTPFDAAALGLGETMGRLADTARWFLDAPVMAALRGVLLGSALALLVTGCRFLLGKI
jgi:type IV secretory pathway VirB3-like protein